MTQHQKDYYNHVEEEYRDYYEPNFKHHSIKRKFISNTLKAAAIGFVIATAVVFSAIRLWVALQGGR